MFRTNFVVRRDIFAGVAAVKAQLSPARGIHFAADNKYERNNREFVLFYLARV